MKIGLIILFIVFLSIIQTSFIPLCFSQSNIPDLMLMFLIAITIVFGFYNVWIWAIIGGFIFDIFSYSQIGVNVIAFFVSCYFISFFSRRLLVGERTGGLLASAFLVSLITLLNEVWILFVNNDFKIMEILKNNFSIFSAIGWKIILNLILFFIFLLLLKQLEKKFFPEKKIMVGN